ncbi:MAG: polyprenyl synthetase family protein [Planctomycetota bacterium]
MRGVFEFPEALRPVQRVIDDALKRVETRFDAQLRSDLPPVNALCKHVEGYRGKMLRPSIAVLCAQAADADAADRFADGAPEVAASEAQVVIGAVCEMVHMATLVHDDVLDEAEVRRRAQTVNALRGNEPAVMLGDYLIASAFHLCSQLDDQSTALEIGRVSMELCAGELLQLHHREQFSLDEATYYEIVMRKTGALIGAACKLGAKHSDRLLAPDLPDRFDAFGRRLGVAFQIQDDLLDLTGEQETVGKSVHKDVEKGKPTLPVIHHLARCSPSERGITLDLLDRVAQGLSGGSEPSGPDARASNRRLADRLRDTGSIAFAEAEARRLVDEAKEALETVPDTLPKLVLLIMADAVVSRSF